MKMNNESFEIYKLIKEDEKTLKDLTRLDSVELIISEINNEKIKEKLQKVIQESKLELIRHEMTILKTSHNLTKKGDKNG